MSLWKQRRMQPHRWDTNVCGSIPPVATKKLERNIKYIDTISVYYEPIHKTVQG